MPRFAPIRSGNDALDRAQDSLARVLNPAMAQLAGLDCLLTGSGAPTAGLGRDGWFYFRTDTPAVANQRIYVRSGGVWTGIV